jgi:hypothetical protein
MGKDNRDVQKTWLSGREGLSLAKTFISSLLAEGSQHKQVSWPSINCNVLQSPVPTHIVEGLERASRKEYVQFLNIAKEIHWQVRSLAFTRRV